MSRARSSEGRVADVPNNPPGASPCEPHAEPQPPWVLRSNDGGVEDAPSREFGSVTVNAHGDRLLVDLDPVLIERPGTKNVEPLVLRLDVPVMCTSAKSGLAMRADRLFRDTSCSPLNHAASRMSQLRNSSSAASQVPNSEIPLLSPLRRTRFEARCPFGVLSVGPAKKVYLLEFVRL
jgi:hypothetical protein